MIIHSFLYALKKNCARKVNLLSRFVFILFLFVSGLEIDVSLTSVILFQLAPYISELFNALTDIII